MTERWTFAAGYAPDAIAGAIVVVAATVAIVEGMIAFRRRRSGATRRRAFGILALRVLAVAALMALAFEITLRIDQVTPQGHKLVVLVDRSASMGVPDALEDGPTETRQARAERAWAASADARQAWSEAGLVVDVRGFHQRSIPYSGEAAETLRAHPDGTASDLVRALTELGDAEETSRTPLVGVVVISDGLVATDQASSDHLVEVAEGLGVPITTMSTGAPLLRDVTLADVRAGEFAFVENVTEFEATVVAHGLRGTTTTIELRRDGTVVETQPLRLGADGVPQTIRFEVAPDRVGQFVYEVVVPDQTDEATTINNRRAFVVKVLRDKVRVLHVAGRPDWDVRALRTLLRRDPNVELLSYYILRGFDDISREDTTAPLSLIPFPTDELFEEELGSFDLVILHNFDVIQHQVAQYVDNMAQYVLDGGALVIIGGDLGFSDGGYASPEIASLLPVETRGGTRLDTDPFRPMLTDAGRRHPITGWLSGGSGRGWEDLPALDTFNPLSLANESAIDATALLVHPTDRDRGGRPRPLLAVAEPGKGRTLVLATGSTWRIGFAPDLPLIDGARPYDLLWLGAVRWLLHDDTSGRLTLETHKPRYRVGEAVELRAKTLSPSYAPEPDVAVSWQLLPLTGVPMGDAPATDGEAGAPLRHGAWTTDGLGRAEETLDGLPVGAYAAVARRELPESTDASSDPRESPEVRRVFIVEPAGRELAQIDADRGTDLLRRIAKATGGDALSAAAGEVLPRDIEVADPFAATPREGVRVDARREVPLWNGWLALALIVATFGGEWLVRRRSGER